MKEAFIDYQIEFFNEAKKLKEILKSKGIKPGILNKLENIQEEFYGKLALYFANEQFMPHKNNKMENPKEQFVEHCFYYWD